MRPDPDRARHAYGELHRGMVFVVAVVVERLDAAILAARVVVPDGADRDVPASLDHFIMNVVGLATVLRSLFGHQMDLVVTARQEIDRAVDVEYVHPAAGIHATIPTPHVRIAAVLLLRAKDWRSYHEGDEPKSRSIHHLSGWLSLSRC